MDAFAYIQLYRWIRKGEWVYIRDHQLGDLCHWCRPSWLQENRWQSDYDVLSYENW